MAPVRMFSPIAPKYSVISLMSDKANIWEISLIALMAGYPETIPTVGVNIQPEWFSDEKLERAFKMLLAMSRNGTAIDPANLAIKLDDPTLSEQISENCVGPGSLEPLMEALRNRYVRARALDFSRSLTTTISTDPDYDVSRLSGDLTNFLRSSIFQRKSDEPLTIGETFDSFKDNLMAELSAPGLKGFSPYLDGLKSLIPEFRRGEIACVAGRPMMGKSAIIAELARHNCLDQNLQGAFFTNDMDREMVLHRLLARICGLDLLRLRSRQLTREDVRKIYQPVLCRACGSDDVFTDKLDIPNNRILHKCAKCGSNNIRIKSDELKEMRFIIDDDRSLDAPKLSNRIRYLKQKYSDLSFAIVDYLQALKLDKYLKRSEAIGQVCQDLRALAHELDIFILVVSQLNRQNEARDNKRPQLSDLRDSGEIEQVMDYVIFIHRDYVYTKKEEDYHHGELIVAKQKNGPIGTVQFAFDPPTQAFSNIGGF